MAFYSWSQGAGFPLCGIPVEACQTFPQLNTAALLCSHSGKKKEALVRSAEVHGASLQARIASTPLH